MRFSTIHQLSSYLMIGCALIPVALSGELSSGLVFLVLGAIAASYFFDPARARPLHARVVRSRAWDLAWNFATVALFLGCLVEVWRDDEGVIVVGVYFLCFLLVNRLWNRRTARDYLQAYIVSFLMLVAGTLINSGLVYALAFVGYVIFATWALTLLHLRREVEESQLLKHAEGAASQPVAIERILNSRRIVGGRFLAGTGAIALGIFAGSTVIFFLFPRVDFGFFGRRRPGVMTTGFSSRLELGQHGLIKDNPQIVMRVEFPDGAPPREPLYFRGASFDTYASGRWTHSENPPSPLTRRGGAYFLLPEQGGPRPRRPEAPLASTLRQEIYLEPIDTYLLLGVSQPLAFALPPLRPGLNYRLETAGEGEVYAYTLNEQGRPQSLASGRRYTAFSVPPPPPERLTREEGPSAEALAQLGPYLALPEDLPARVRELAQNITRGAEGPYAKAEAVARHLRSRYRYTLALGRDPRYEPIEDFLFVQQAGHCEYFASAMAILLRAVGVPTRNITGFYGGEWNAYGNYLAVRQGDAHAWVEVYLGESVGWVSFDPTPSGEALGRTGGLFAQLRMLVDTVQLAWFKYVIEYDLGKQIDLLAAMRRWLSGERTAREDAGGASVLSARGLARYRRPALVGIGALLLVAVLLWRRHKRPVGGVRSGISRRTQQAIERAVRALARRGLVRSEAETLAELGERARVARDPGAVPFALLVERYYAARFGGSTPDAQELDALAQEVIRPRAEASAVARAETA